MIDSLNAQADQQLDRDRAARLVPPDWPTQRELGLVCDVARDRCSDCAQRDRCEWQLSKQTQDQQQEDHMLRYKPGDIAKNLPTEETVPAPEPREDSATVTPLDEDETDPLATPGKCADCSARTVNSEGQTGCREGMSAHMPIGCAEWHAAPAPKPARKPRADKGKPRGPRAVPAQERDCSDPATGEVAAPAPKRTRTRTKATPAPAQSEAQKLATVADELTGLRAQRASLDTRIEAIQDGLTEQQFAAVEALQKAVGSA